jgi:4a-hydroxytetrahydrobiopterin dehydratase
MEVYQDDTIRQWLQSQLPRWRLEGKELVRTYQTGDWQRTTLLAGAIAFIGESAFHHPDLELSYPRLTVRLTTHDAGGVTTRDLELARMIESHVTWRPGPESVFTGPPGGWVE